jgi:hypothetical protein
MAETGAGAAKWVGWLSGACAVHCAAAPALAVLAPVAAAGEAVEGVVLLGLPLVTGALLWGGVRRHGNYFPAIPVVAAMLLWGAAWLGVVAEPASALLVAAGGVLSYAGLSWSRRLQCRCEAASPAGATEAALRV